MTLEGLGNELSEFADVLYNVRSISLVSTKE